MDKVAELLQQLAVKLGVTVEYLWPILLRHTMVEALASVVVGGAALLGGWLLFVRWCRRDIEELMEEYGPLPIIAGLMLTILSIIYTASLPAYAADIAAPEAAVIHDLAGRVK